jgi:hypothetical protein
VIRLRLVVVVSPLRAKRMGLLYTFYRQKRIPPGLPGKKFRLKQWAEYPIYAYKLRNAACVLA